MVSKHCLHCGINAHPKSRHPSTLKTELAIWLVAITIGVAAGVWSAITAPTSTPLSRSVQSLALSSVRTGDAGPASPVYEDPSTGEAGAPVLTRLLDVVVAFLRTAWWVLLVPVAFSIWRQWRTFPVCRACGSRDLTEVTTPHGALPPVG